MRDQMDEHYPALSGRRSGLMDGHVDEARRLLWRAYQHGSLSEDEFVTTLDRLECVSPEVDTTWSPATGAVEPSAN